MEKLRKISKVVDKILNVCYWFLIIAGAVVVMCFGLVAFVPSLRDTIMDGRWSVSLGSVDLELAKDVVTYNDAIRVTAIVTMLSMVVLVIFTCYGIKLLRRIMEPMKKQQPFVGTVSRNLMKLGWVLIIGSLVFSVVNCVGAGLMQTTFDLSNLLLSDKVIGVKTDITMEIDATAILSGVLLLLLSHVFSYGEKLQKQDDETL